LRYRGKKDFSISKNSELFQINNSVIAGFLIGCHFCSVILNFFKILKEWAIFIFRMRESDKEASFREELNYRRTKVGRRKGHRSGLITWDTTGRLDGSAERNGLER